MTSLFFCHSVVLAVAAGEGEVIRKPEVVVEYDKYMGGVDRSDQMVSYATFNCRTLKWWKRVVFHVLNLAVVNAYLAYKHHVGAASRLPQEAGEGTGGVG